MLDKSPNLLPAWTCFAMLEGNCWHERISDANCYVFPSSLSLNGYGFLKRDGPPTD